MRGMKCFEFILLEAYCCLFGLRRAGLFASTANGAGWYMALPLRKIIRLKMAKSIAWRSTPQLRHPCAVSKIENTQAPSFFA